MKSPTVLLTVSRQQTSTPGDDQGSVTVTDAGESIVYNLTTPSARPRSERIGKKRKASGHAPVTDPVGRAVLDLVDLEKRKNEPKIEPKSWTQMNYSSDPAWDLSKNYPRTPNMRQKLK